MGLIQDYAKKRRERAEKATFGREWHGRNTVRAPSDQPHVFFNIALISQARATDWTRIRRNLAVTLASLRAQTNPNWTAYICCQDQPEGIDFDDQVQFIPFETADEVTHKTKFDNHAKRHKVLSLITQSYQGDGYLFALDGDDILHPKLVEHVITANNGRGYIIDRGYMWDVQSHNLAPLQPGWLDQAGGKRAFYKECGSSSMLRIDFRDNLNGLEIFENMGPHKYRPMNMEALGFPLSPIPFPAALYAVNHGENMRQIRGKLGPKLTYMKRHRLSEAKMHAARAEFDLDKLLGAADVITS